MRVHYDKLQVLKIEAPGKIPEGKYRGEIVEIDLRDHPKKTQAKQVRLKLQTSRGQDGPYVNTICKDYTVSDARPTAFMRDVGLFHDRAGVKKIVEAVRAGRFGDVSPNLLYRQVEFEVNTGYHGDGYPHPLSRVGELSLPEELIAQIEQQGEGDPRAEIEEQNEQAQEEAICS